MTEVAWAPAFACPNCRRPLQGFDAACVCVCGERFSRRDIVYRFADRVLPELQPFLEQYRQVRRADGHALRTREAYRRLPDAAPRAGAEAEWRIRRESFERLCRLCALRDGRRLRALDVGAGNGWLSNRLTAMGHRAVAVDINDDAEDGLLACAAYGEASALVQADFDALPFAGRQFDLVVMNASLHYAPRPYRTLQALAALVADGGALVVMDSPTFRRREDGESMVADQMAQLQARYGFGWPVVPGSGYLTFEGLEEAAGAVGFRGAFFPSHGSIRWQVGRLLARPRLGRAPAGFGVWLARAAGDLG